MQKPLHYGHQAWDVNAHVAMSTFVLATALACMVGEEGLEPSATCVQSTESAADVLPGAELTTGFEPAQA